MSADEARLFCEAGPGVGLGHMARCLALAEALEEDGLRPVFVTGPAGVDALGWMAPGRFPVRAPEALDENMCVVAVVDDYRADRTRLKNIGAGAGVTIVMDDLADRELAADIVVNPAMGVGPGAYATLTPGGTRLLLGPSFAPIRTDIRSRRANVLPARVSCAPNTGSILVTAGGLDGRGLAPAFLSAVLDSPAAENHDVDVALGGQALSWPDVDALAARHSPRVRAHRDVPDITNLYANAGASLGPGGVALLEKMCLGLPTLAVIVAENQRASVEGLVSLGCVASVDATADDETATMFQAKVRAAFEEFLTSEAALDDMWRRGAALIDGLGARRIVLAARPETNRDGLPVTLRQFTADDCALLLSWQSEPDMRKYFRDPEVPEPADHRTWCAARLADPFGVCEMIVVDGRPVGMVRFDPPPDALFDGPGEVSVLLSGSEQGRGTGAAALVSLRRLLRERELRAEVHPDNRASWASFRRAGFVPLSENCATAPALSAVRP